MLLVCLLLEPVESRWMAVCCMQLRLWLLRRGLTLATQCREVVGSKVPVLGTSCARCCLCTT